MGRIHGVAHRHPPALTPLPAFLSIRAEQEILTLYSIPLIDISLTFTMCWHWGTEAWGSESAQAEGEAYAPAHIDCPPSNTHRLGPLGTPGEAAMNVARLLESDKCRFRLYYLLAEQISEPQFPYL